MAAGINQNWERAVYGSSATSMRGRPAENHAHSAVLGELPATACFMNAIRLVLVASVLLPLVTSLAIPTKARRGRSNRSTGVLTLAITLLYVLEQLANPVENAARECRGALSAAPNVYLHFAKSNIATVMPVPNASP
jgi:hypothetical protein